MRGCDWFTLRRKDSRYFWTCKKKTHISGPAALRHCTKTVVWCKRSSFPDVPALLEPDPSGYGMVHFDHRCGICLSQVMPWCNLQPAIPEDTDPMLCHLQLAHSPAMDREGTLFQITSRMLRLFQFSINCSNVIFLSKCIVINFM